MKRGTDIFKWQKEGWFRCVNLAKKDNPHGAKGFAKGNFNLLDLHILANHEPAPAPGHSEGWAIWQDCLFHCGEFRGALVSVKQRKEGKETFVSLEIEFPLV